MKLSHLLALPAALLTSVLAASNPEYDEHLHLLPLPNGYLYAGFNFTASTSLSDYRAQHFRYFPRSLGQILQYSHTEELHLRFALGRWDEQSWGSRPRDGRREGGTGVEIWAWLDGEGGGAKMEERWSSLVNSLSGLFCASLNFIDGTKTTRPVISFNPEGTLQSSGSGRLELLHGTLPHEVVCTENLTPFLKLLPCKGKAGISSLLDGHKVFDANWQTMSIDVRPVCDLNGDCRVEIQQTVDIVMDIERSMRPRDDPIPRPKPIEEIECDESKHYHGHDTCYPKPREGEIAWSLSKTFGTSIRGSCHLAEGEEGFDVSLEVPSERTVDTVPAAGLQQHQAGGLRRFKVPSSSQNFDLSLPQQSLTQQIPLPEPPLYASRQMTGYGQERGGMHAVLRNPHPYPQRIVYLESLPWFLRPYMHTLKVTGPDRKEVKSEKMYYTPAIDRQRGTHLELLLTIPAQSKVELTYDFEKAILRYTEYPPDANRGFDVAPAVIRILPRNTTTTGDQLGSSYLRTTSLLLPLPTPDFSMPYNVIILTSTVIALGFGSVFNLLTRRFVLVEEAPASPLALKVKGLLGNMAEMVARIREKIRRRSMKLERKGVADAGGVDKDADSDEPVVANGEPKKAESRKDR